MKYSYPCARGCKTKKGKPREYKKKSPYPSKERLCYGCYGAARERYNNELLFYQADRKRYNEELLERRCLPAPSPPLETHQPSAPNAEIPVQSYTYACTQTTEKVGPLVPPHGYTIPKYNDDMASNATGRRYVNGSRYYGDEIDDSWKKITIADVLRTKKMKFVVKTEGDDTTTVEVSSIRNSDLSDEIEMAWRDADFALAAATMASSAFLLAAS